MITSSASHSSSLVHAKSSDKGHIIVWFKKDVRLIDHEPLHKAIQEASSSKGRIRVLLLYVYEDDIVSEEDFVYCHLKFINEGLREVISKVKALGGRFSIMRGRVPDIFDTIASEGVEEIGVYGPVSTKSKSKLLAIYAHEETSNMVSRRRIERTKDWAKSNSIPIVWFNQTGVTKKLETRDGWAKKWTRLMMRPLLSAPTTLTNLCVQVKYSKSILSAEELNISKDVKPEAMVGGESLAQDLLESFTIGKRSVGFSKNISSPNTAWEGCSRLAPYLTWGHISLRTVYRRAKSLRERMKIDKKLRESAQNTWARDLSSFESRLRWRSHFMQKLEDEPEMETENLCRVFDGMRERNYDENLKLRFVAWCQGKTGYPMIDAVMRALHVGGWINFRMRAMLVSFASYTLWLDWRNTSRFLAKHFLDYEPGIHYSQFQMQSGTTGINALRIYNAVKQAKDHDKEGKFVKKYVEELKNVPKKYIFEPWKMPREVQRQVGCIIEKDYPAPIVDQKEAYSFARRTIGEIRKQQKTKEEAQQIQKKHGSRMHSRNKTSSNSTKRQTSTVPSKKNSKKKKLSQQSSITTFFKAA